MPDDQKTSDAKQIYDVRLKPDHAGQFGVYLNELYASFRETLCHMAAAMGEEIFFHEAEDRHLLGGGPAIWLECSDAFAARLTGIERVESCDLFDQYLETYRDGQGGVPSMTDAVLVTLQSWDKDARATYMLQEEIRSATEASGMRGEVLFRGYNNDSGCVDILCPASFVTTLELLESAPRVETRPVSAAQGAHTPKISSPKFKN